MELELEEGGAGGAELRWGTSGVGAEPCGGERADVVVFYCLLSRLGTSTGIQSDLLSRVSDPG